MLCTFICSRLFSLEKIEISGLGSPWIFIIIIIIIFIQGTHSPWLFSGGPCRNYQLSIINQINVHLQGSMITTERIICYFSVLQFELNCITFVGSRFITFSVKLYYFYGGVSF